MSHPVGNYHIPTGCFYNIQFVFEGEDFPGAELEMRASLEQGVASVYAVAGDDLAVHVENLSEKVLAADLDTVSRNEIAVESEEPVLIRLVIDTAADRIVMVVKLLRVGARPMVSIRHLKHPRADAFVLDVPVLVVPRRTISVEPAQILLSDSTRRR